MEILNRLIKKLAVIALLTTAVIPTKEAEAAADSRFYKIEAAFLYNFFNYITWPQFDSPRQLSNATICMYGDTPLYNSLQYVKLKKAQERDLRLRKLDDLNSLEGCNILFISNVRVNVSEVRKRSKGILLASDIPGFLDSGGMVELTEDDGRVLMSIDNTTLSNSGFQVSSRLLSLARRID